MIRIPTIASREHPDERQFVVLQQVMQESFPNVAKKLKKTTFAGGSMIWRWQGSNPSLDPLVLMAHQDVVPASPEGWRHPPFDGVIDGDEIIGRGSMDTKNTLFGIFQAVEELLISGFVPEADVYLASSADEEVSGGGAEQTVAWLKRQGVRPALVLDEGGAIVSGVLPTASKALALLGVIEKGYVTVKFTARSNGGHASMPPKNTPIARLSAFVASVEQRFPLKTKMIPEVAALFQTAAPSMKFPYRLLFGNLWLFRGLVTFLLPRINPYGRAMLSDNHRFHHAKRQRCRQCDSGRSLCSM
ncbi:MAG: M20/M25/M40 family metallo-hydrolase [Bacillus subtilis]|nr:M20/M25/M40 family metallo-hydrolase [Bacillus subtilis]